MSRRRLSVGHPPTGMPAIHTRGGIRHLSIDGESGEAFQPSFLLDQLFDELRRHVGGLPFVVLVHGWGTEQAESFVQSLPAGSHSDSIWLIAGSETPARVVWPPRECSILLDLRKEKDERIYRNLMIDLAFFPGIEEQETALARKLTRRVRAVIVELDGVFSQAVVKVFRQGPATILLRRSSDRVEIADRPPTKRAANFQMLGALLSKEVRELEERPDRRRHLHASILEAMRALAEHPTWDEDLVRLADREHWPAWAVQSLPALYVPLKSKDGDLRRGLVWRYIADCVPQELEIDVELCAGQFLELRMTSAVADLIAEIASILTAQLAGSPFSRDRGFLTVVIQALGDLDLQFQANGNLEAAEKLQKVRRKILEDERVIPDAPTQDDIPDE